MTMEPGYVGCNYCKNFVRSHQCRSYTLGETRFTACMSESCQVQLINARLTYISDKDKKEYEEEKRIRELELTPVKCAFCSHLLVPKNSSYFVEDKNRKIYCCTADDCHDKLVDARTAYWARKECRPVSNKDILSVFAEPGAVVTFPVPFRAEYLYFQYTTKCASCECILNTKFFRIYGQKIFHLCPACAMVNLKLWETKVHAQKAEIVENLPTSTRWTFPSKDLRKCWDIHFNESIGMF